MALVKIYIAEITSGSHILWAMFFLLMLYDPSNPQEMELGHLGTWVCPDMCK